MSNLKYKCELQITKATTARLKFKLIVDLL